MDQLSALALAISVSVIVSTIAIRRIDGKAPQLSVATICFGAFNWTRVSRRGLRSETLEDASNSWDCSGIRAL
jgi:hypothetical protein